MEVAKVGAEATKAVAETTGKAIDAARESGGFVVKVFGGAFEAYGAAWKDRADFYRWMNFNSTMDKVEKITAERTAAGKRTAIYPIPMVAAIPLLENASLEDDEGLQGMWAGLIAGAAMAPEEARRSKSFATVLAAMTPLDARLLVQRQYDGKPTAKFDRTYGGLLSTDERVRSKQLAVAHANLERLGCFETIDRSLEEVVRKIGGVRDVRRLPSVMGTAPPKKTSIRITAFGRELLSACMVDSHKGE